MCIRDSVIRARRRLRRGVVLGRQCAHRIKEMAQTPMHFLAAASEYDVLLDPWNQFSPMADAMGTRSTSRTYTVVDALDLKRRR